MPNEGLIVVDLQNDFLPGGNLAVPDGDKVIPVINKIMESFAPTRIFLTRDVHPVGHKSFASSHEGKTVFDKVVLHDIEQVLWPDHCIVGTAGAAITELLDAPEDAKVTDKGMDPEYDSYSGFRDAGGAATSLEKQLAAEGLKKGSTMYICGLATDYCVKATAIDAAKLGLRVRVVIDACRGVAAETTEQALAEMEDAGVAFVRSVDLTTTVPAVL